MSERYGCPDCGFTGDIDTLPVQCPICGHVSMEHLHLTKGGNGSHWEGCADVHWDCKISQLQAEIDRLQEKLHDEMGQLEIATDLGNKRWLALNDIYENGEKHNSNWCKRKAQEGLGIR